MSIARRFAAAVVRPILRIHAVACRRFPAMFRLSAQVVGTASLVVALGLATDPSANAASGTVGKLLSPQFHGWQSPSAVPPGNGDYVFIDAPAAGSTASGSVTISGRFGNSSTDPNGGGGGGGTSFATKPQVVIAMIDTGGNPYHVDFRDQTRLVHPSTYLTGFPSTAKAAPLCFVDGTGTGPFTYNDNCLASFSANITADASTVAVNDLVWYPGTRLMSKSFAHTDVGTPPGVDSGGGDTLTSHGSWVSSAAVGKKFGNCPECLLVILEGDTVDAIDDAYLWAAQQPWIDVITSSTSVGIIGVGLNPGIYPGFHDAAVAATNNGKIFLNAAGNGAGNVGLAPTSTFVLGSSSPAAISVGASTSIGLASHWSDFPAEIMANGNSRGVAETASMSAETAVGGTSFSSPGAAGVLAKSLLEARGICKDYTEGVTGTGAVKNLLRNINATGGCAVSTGPAANGILTRDELHEAFVKNAIPPYDQLSTIPGPIGWAKNAYGYVDLGNGVGNGGLTIQPAVTASILGTQPIPVRSLEQFWYDVVVREGQSFIWGSRPVADGDGDAFPRDDAACMPDCAPTELQRYAEGFAGLSSSSSYQDLFDILGVSADQFTQQGASGLGGLRRPTPSVAGVIAETGDITISNDATTLTVRLALAGLLDGQIPTVRSNPVTYEVGFSANHNGLVQQYRLSYEYQALDFFALLEGQISEPLTDAFGVFADTTPDPASQLSSICPITTDLSASDYDVDTGEAVWVIPLSAFTQDNRPVGNACASFTNGGRALRGGDTMTGITGSSVLTLAVVNFGNGLGLFGESTAADYILTSATDTDNDGLTDGPDQCDDTPAGASVDARGCHVSLKVNGQAAGTGLLIGSAWSLAVNFSERAPVDGNYVVEAKYGTATETRTLSGTAPALSASLAATSFSKAHDAQGRYPVSEGSPLEVGFTVTTSGGDATAKRYFMSFGDGTDSGVPQSSPTFSHIYEEAGEHHAYAIVTQNNGNDSDTSDEVVITTVTSVTVEPGLVDAHAVLTFAFTDGNVAPAAVSFTTTGSTGTSYVLDFGDGDSDDNGNPTPNLISGNGAPTGTLTHIYSVPGTYVATLTMTGTGTPTTESATATITVVASRRLTAQLSVSPSTVVAGNAATPVTMDASQTVPANGKALGDYTYTFDFGDGSDPVGPGTAMTAEHVYTTAGTYELVLTVSEAVQGAAAKSGRTTKAAATGPATSVVRSQVQVKPAPAPATPQRGGALSLWLLLPMLLVTVRRKR